MPHYTVTYDRYDGRTRPTRAKIWQIPAATPKDAAKYVLSTEIGHSKIKIIKILEDKGHDSRIYWRAKWSAALRNMPPRVAYHKYWKECKRGTVPLPDFIKQRAKKKMKVENGVVLELVKEQFTYGQTAALARCVGETNSKWMCQHINSARQRGNKPRDPARQAMLLALAGPDGRKFAMAKLTELGIIHRYEV